MRRMLVAALVVALGANVLSACTKPADKTVIAFLLASDNSVRWAESDEPAFRHRLELTCADCEYLTRNAGGDAEVQARQFAEVVKDGADVVVLNAVSGESGEGLVAGAGSIPIVAYDRYVAGADFFVSYDADKIGTQMAMAVVADVGERASVLVINGSQADANGVAIKRAVHGVLTPSRARVLAELDPDSWSADEAQAWMATQLRKTPATAFDAVLAANDTQAEGVVAALTEAKVRPRNWPVVTGQDADIEALRRIVTGQQTLTVFKSFPREAQKAADLAVSLALGAKIDGAEDFEGVPSYIFEPIVVTIDNLTNTVVRDGIHSTTEICTEEILDRCLELGIR